jgi:hypothetical protein
VTAASYSVWDIFRLTSISHTIESPGCDDRQSPVLLESGFLLREITYRLDRGSSG